MVPGATYPVSVTMKNTSNIYWAPSTVSLGSQNPDNNTTWGMSNVALASYVAPGANATFSFNVTAPATLGTQNFQWRLLKGAGNWIGPATPNVPVLISADEAAFVSQSVPATMQPGKVYSATITLRNTGVSTWSTTALHRLGSQNPQDNTTWGLSRADLPGDVPPGASVTIPIDVLAPATAGTYNFQWRLVHGTTWFGVTTPNVAVNVGSLGSPVAGMQFIHVDHLNTPREIYDASSQLRWKWDQREPFGENVPDENPSSLGAFEFALRFPGQYFDKETNLAYNVARDYSSDLGRFVQSDPIGLRGGINTFGYVYGSPLNYIDPTGHGGLGLVGAVVVTGFVGAAAEGITTVIGNACSGAPLSTNLPGALVGGFIEGGVMGVAAMAPAPAVATVGLTTMLYPSASRVLVGIIVGAGGNSLVVTKVLSP